MTTTDTMAADALRRLRHSIATSAGMHKLQIRRRAAVIRQEIPCTPAPPSTPPSA